MAKGRKEKVGLDYFPLYTDIWEDDKLKFIPAKFFEYGKVVVTEMLAYIYRHKGYYMLYDDDSLLMLAKESGPNVTPGLVGEVVTELLNRDFLDRIMHKRFSILTSYNIQQTYERICRDSGRVGKFGKGVFIHTNHRIVLYERVSNQFPTQENQFPTQEIELTGGEIPQRIEKNRIEKKREEERGLPPPHEFFESILQDKIFTDPVMALHRIDEQKLESLLRRFFASKKMLHEDSWTGLPDCRKNFLNWIPFELNAGAKTIGDLKKNGTHIQNYQSPRIHDEVPVDPVELERKNKAARESFRHMIEQDIELISVNENAVLKFSQIKFDILLDEQLVEYTPEEKQHYVQLARDERIRELNLRFDQATRMILRHYESGKIPDTERRGIAALSKEFAYRDYLKKKVSITPQPKHMKKPTLELVHIELSKLKS